MSYLRRLISVLVTKEEPRRTVPQASEHWGGGGREVPTAQMPVTKWIRKNDP